MSLKPLICNQIHVCTIHHGLRQTEVTYKRTFVTVFKLSHGMKYYANKSSGKSCAYWVAQHIFFQVIPG